MLTREDHSLLHLQNSFQHCQQVFFFQLLKRCRTKAEITEEISTSQSSGLGLDELDELEAKAQAENTKRATSSGI